MPSYLTALEYDAAFGIYADEIGAPDHNRPDGTALGWIDVVTDVAQLAVNNDNSNKNSGNSAIRNDGNVAAIANDKTQIVDNDKKQVAGAPVARPCRMDTCFDYTKCYEAHRQLLVYVYPADTLANAVGSAPPPISLNYQKILSAITESRYYTADPERACLFVLGIDTLDRDSLSDDYVRNVPSRLQRLPYWNNGRNHVIFNLYSGTWPDYAENSLGFDTGDAILAKASMSVRQIRPGFDISIPLFHKQHPLRAGNNGFVSSNNFPTNKKYLLAFKGKR